MQGACALHRPWPGLTRLLVQVLVTCNDFMDPDFKQNLCATVEDLLHMGTVPIFNENDSISKGAKQSKVPRSVDALLRRTVCKQREVVWGQ